MSDSSLFKIRAFGKTLSNMFILLNFTNGFEPAELSNNVQLALVKLFTYKNCSSHNLLEGINIYMSVPPCSTFSIWTSLLLLFC